MKKDLTIREIDAGQKSGLSVIEIYKKAGFKDYKKRASDFESMREKLVSEMQTTMQAIKSEFAKRGMHKWEDVDKKRRELEDYIIGNSKFIEEEVGTRIDDFSIEEKFLNEMSPSDFISWVDNAKKTGYTDLGEWIDRKIQSIRELVRKKIASHDGNLVGNTESEYDKKDSNNPHNLTAKHILLYLYEKDRKMNENKHPALVVRVIPTKVNSVKYAKKAFDELGAYLQGEANDKQRQTFEKYKAQLRDLGIRDWIEKRIKGD